MRAFIKAAALAAVIALVAVPVIEPVAAFAQQTITTVSSAPDVTTVTVPADTSTVVTIPAGSWATNVLDVVGAILMAAVASLIAVALRFLPDWLRPLVTTAVQSAVVGIVRQGIAYAIQAIDGFDKDKTIDVNVGSAAVATALRYVIDHAPSFLVALAGGEEAIKDKIIALLGDFGITLDAETSPEAVKAGADLQPAKG